MQNSPADHQWVRVSSRVKIESSHFSADIDQISPQSIVLKNIEAKEGAPTECSVFQIRVFTLTERAHLINVELQSPLKSLFLPNSTELTLHIREPSSLATMQEILAILRKSQHIDICRHQDVEALGRSNGFEQINFIPQTLPDLDYHELKSNSEFLGHSFSMPLLITGMTGGIQKAADINSKLAKLASQFKIPLGLGSQRLALENSEHEAIFRVKNQHPDLFLIGNIGISQLGSDEYTARCQRAVDMIAADALAIHLNITQELIQVEGDRNFSGLKERIGEVCARLSVPVIVKEVGAGMDVCTARSLKALGVSAIDVGGRGGTSWAYIEGLRSNSEETRKVAESFRNWGIPTAHSLAAMVEDGIDLPLIATGGVRDGITIAKASALGAQMVGVGLPILRAVSESYEAAERLLHRFQKELKISMLATGSKNLTGLRKRICYETPYSSILKKQIERRNPF